MSKSEISNAQDHYQQLEQAFISVDSAYPKSIASLRSRAHILKSQLEASITHQSSIRRQLNYLKSQNEFTEIVSAVENISSLNKAAKSLKYILDLHEIKYIDYNSDPEFSSTLINITFRLP